MGQIKILEVFYWVQTRLNSMGYTGSQSIFLHQYHVKYIAHNQRNQASDDEKKMVM